MNRMKISRFLMRRPFEGAVSTARYSARRPGLLGRQDNVGVYTITVPGGHGYKYVRLLQGKVASLAMALDRANVGTTGDTPIWLDTDLDGRLIIVGTRYEGT